MGGKITNCHRAKLCFTGINPSWYLITFVENWSRQFWEITPNWSTDGQMHRQMDIAHFKIPFWREPVSDDKWSDCSTIFTLKARHIIILTQDIICWFGIGSVFKPVKAFTYAVFAWMYQPFTFSFAMQTSMTPKTRLCLPCIHYYDLSHLWHDLYLGLVEIAVLMWFRLVALSILRNVIWDLVWCVCPLKLRNGIGPWTLTLDCDRVTRLTSDIALIPTHVWNPTNNLIV